MQEITIEDIIVNEKESLSNNNEAINDYKDQEVGFRYSTDLTASQKIAFVESVIGLLIDEDEMDYNGIIRDLAFDYVMIAVFTDFDTSYIDNLDEMEKVVKNTNIVEILKEEVSQDLIDELNKAIDQNIYYKTGINLHSVENSISDFVNIFNNFVKDIDVDKIKESLDAVRNISNSLTVDKIVEAYTESSLMNKKKEVDNDDV